MAESREEWKARMGIGQRSLVTQTTGAGSTQTRPVLDETKPRVAGAVTEHWDGRTDATVFPETVRIKHRAQEVGQ